MSYPETREIATKLRELVNKAPAGGIFTRSETSPTVDGIGLLDGPAWFFLAQPDGVTYMVSVQPVGGLSS